jgi:hypothetical protein
MPVCDRSDHPEREHWHYGPGGCYWCTDVNSPLLQQRGTSHESDGRIYSKTSKEARDADVRR